MNAATVEQMLDESKAKNSAKIAAMAPVRPAMLLPVRDEDRPLGYARISIACEVRDDIADRIKRDQVCSLLMLSAVTKAAEQFINELALQADA